MLRQLLLNLDVSAGAWWPIQHIAYSRSSLLRGGRGAWTRDEWTRARLEGYEGAVPDHLDAATAQARFVSRAFGAERRKLESGWRLADWIRAEGVRSVLEIGCGEMVTSWAIKVCTPEVRYVASDFDALVIERSRAVPALTGIETRVADVDALSTPEIESFDLVVGWDVLYAFSTERLIALLEKFRRGGTRLMMCSGQIVGPLRALLYAAKSRAFNYKAQCAAGVIRDHGFKCSVRYYDLLARRVGLRCRLVDSPPVDERFGDCYFFLLFESAASRTLRARPEQAVTRGN